MDITVNTKRGIQVKDQWVECEITRSHDSVGPVKVARAVTIPAYSEFVMTGLCNSLPAEEDKTFIFEASEVAKEKLLIAESLTRPKSCKIPIKMINHSTSPIRLNKGLVLGILQPVGSVMPKNEEYNIRQHEEPQGVSVCRLKTHEDKHQRELSNAHSSSNNEESHPDGTNCTCIFEEEDGTSAYPQVSRTNEFNTRSTSTLTIIISSKYCILRGRTENEVEKTIVGISRCICKGTYWNIKMHLQRHLLKVLF